MTEFSLTVDNAGQYLVANDIVDRETVTGIEALGGGVSNTVLRVTTNGECLIVKQPLPNLAVEDDWPADTERVHNEAAAARTYETVIRNTGLSDICVPVVVFEDTTNHTIATTCAPSSSTMWKRELLDGRVDVRVAETLGRFLGLSHRSTANDSEIEGTFANKAPFEQLRLDPYHRTVADRHPDVAPLIEAELDRIRAVDRTLVHGDFSPKNVLVDRRANPQTIWLLDFEVAHWGDPAFDTAFMLNHLFIKSIYKASEQESYIEAARRFWRTYAEQVDWTIEADTVRELAVLMLARVDGKSPVEYVTSSETKDALRSAAKQALQNRVETFDEFVDLVTEVTRT